MSDSSFSMVFPGQGSQAIGMSSALGEAYPVVAQTYAEATDVLGYDLWELVQNGPLEALNQTARTQPAMLAAGVSVWRVWLEQGGAMPKLMAGHSLGEYSALVCAGSIEFSDAVRLVSERGRFMQEAVPAGAGGMAAILGLDDERVREVCVSAESGEVVEAVNLNAPGQVVIAGAKAAVDRACDLAKAAGAKRVLSLPVSVPSHCSLMEPAAERLREQLSAIPIASPSIPVLHNVNVELAGDADSIRDLLAAQLHHPVRWVETVRRIAASGCSDLLEAGPGKVLAGLTKRIDRGLTGSAVFDPISLHQALEGLK
ncbi:MAG: ACP S-malonyltransferase [Candidatus Thiodiazotropha sp. (ex Dulcina madagascariensis)]|nr:ACP S-malonyltransferase [Candidatus Thiodiazotropha sp. (ex Dulcina madagascariensis)]